MPSLSDKLKSLGVKPAAEIKPQTVKKMRSPLEEALGGRWISTRRGDAFVVEQVYSTEYRHGSVPIHMTAPLDTLAAWARDERVGSLALPRSLISST